MDHRTIPPQEIDLHPTSYCDSREGVFFWQGDLYRGINEAYAPFYHKLFDDGVVEQLGTKGFLVEKVGGGDGFDQRS